jgi:hypothetical protein
MTDRTELVTTERLPAVNLQNAIDTATALGPDGVAVLKELQIILTNEREYQAEVAFDEARNRVIERLTRTGIPHDKQRKVTKAGFMVGYSSAMQITKSLRDAGAIEEGFAWQFDTDYIGDHPVSVCILKHRDGHQERAHSPITEGGRKDNPATSDMDALKANVNMGDRTALQRVWGISHLTEDIQDDDGPQPNHNYERVTDAEALQLEARCNEVGEAEGREHGEVAEQLKRRTRIEHLSDLPHEHFEQVMGVLDKRMTAALERLAK